MAEQNINGQKNNVDNARKKGWSKVLISSLLLVLVLGLVFFVFGKMSQGKQIGYTQFTADLTSGYIKEVSFNANKVDVLYFDGTKGWFYNRAAFEEDALADITAFNEYALAHDLKQVVIVPGSTTTFSVLNLLYPILLIGCSIVLITIVFKKLGSVNNKSFDFVKNRARIIPSNVKFDSVAGVDEEKEELKEIIEFLRNPKKYIDIGARIPKGVLLVGQPGTGKTLLAKAVAGEAEVPFFSISGSDFMELFVGVGASRVRDLFENAKKAKPCIVFIDEIDAVGRQRGTGMGGGNDEREQTLNQLLVQMDGFEENEGIIVMAATNRVDILDPALLRPGRFDRQIVIHAPDVRGREEILKVHAKNKPLASDVDLKVVARITSGFTGADLENLLNESAILAARDNRTKISMNDINNGISKVTMGPQKRSRIVTDKDKRITAVHESGHAIIERLVENSNPVHEVSIVPRGAAGGYTLSRPETDDEYMTKNKLFDTITMFLGGRTAEKLFLSDITTGASNDLERATNVARKMVTEWGMSSTIGNVSFGSGTSLFLGRDYQERAVYSEKEASVIDEEVRSIMTECTRRAEKILADHKAVLETMVEVLLEKETIYSDEVNMIISGAGAKEVCEFIDNKNKPQGGETVAESGAQGVTTENANNDGATVNAKKENSVLDNLIKTAKVRKNRIGDNNLKVDESEKLDINKIKAGAVDAGAQAEVDTKSAGTDDQSAENKANEADEKLVNTSEEKIVGEQAKDKTAGNKADKKESLTQKTKKSTLTKKAETKKDE